MLPLTRIASKSPMQARPWPMCRPSTPTSRESACQCVLVLKKFTPTYIAGMSSYTNPWRWEHEHIYDTPPCLQCMLLCMQKYDYMIQYKPSKEKILANCLSQLPSYKESLPIAINNIQHVQLSNDKLDVIQAAVECDPNLQHPVLPHP